MTPFLDDITQLPVTPPSSDTDPDTDIVLASAVHVLSTEATALSCLARLYQTDPSARNGFAKAVETITASAASGGKLIVCGVGKSGKIGEKLVATMNSLGVLSVFLHPVEALHGDIGILRPQDVILLITFSGRSPELVTILSHLPSSLPLLSMTATTNLPTNITHPRPDVIILPTPIHESEETSFGVAAPTTSTTVTIALGDALAIAVASKIYARDGKSPREIFQANHPGGAIGMR